jgi:hypothetical protein
VLGGPGPGPISPGHARRGLTARGVSRLRERSSPIQLFDLLPNPDHSCWTSQFTHKPYNDHTAEHFKVLISRIAFEI